MWPTPASEDSRGDRARDVAAVERRSRPACGDAHAGDAPRPARSARCRRRPRCRRSRRRARSSRARARPRGRGRRAPAGRCTASTVSPGVRGAALDVEQHLAADHQLGQAALASRPRGRSSRPSRRAAAPRSRSATSSTSSQLVRDQDDRRAVGAQLAQHGEQLVDLLRRQHRGRLVEDQHARVAVERLEDLDALLLADADLLDRARRGRPRRP